MGAGEAMAFTGYSYIRIDVPKNQYLFQHRLAPLIESKQA